MSVREKILSEDYAEFFYPGFEPKEEIIESFGGEFYQPISGTLSTIYVPLEKTKPFDFKNYSYTSYPKIYGLMDDVALSAAGITQVINQPVLSLDGEGTVIAMADTGIDIYNPLFIDEDGNSKILKLWDQSDNSGRLPTILENEELTNTLSLKINFGSELDGREINELLKNRDVTGNIGRDFIGHGTFLAGLCAKAAPKAKFIIVKLKEAKEYLKEYYNVSENTTCYQENDIILAVNYAKTYSILFGKPIVLFLGLGTNQGAHMGKSFLSEELGNFRNNIGSAAVCAAGNEGNARHHFSGNIDLSKDYKEDIEVRVGENIDGFMMEVWISPPNIFEVGIVSPTGEIIERIDARLNASVVTELIFEETVVSVNYDIVEGASGNELILIKLTKPTAGIWKIIVYGDEENKGRFDAWLPITEFGTEEIFFLMPDPSLTITSPGMAENVITVGAYDMLNNIFYAESGRGETGRKYIKPDVVAPGVEVESVGKNGVIERRSGTSISAAIAAGGIADLLQWVVLREKGKVFTSKNIKSYIVRGAIRDKGVIYPNEEVGYGRLNIYNSLDKLR